MKALGICGSARRGGNTDLLIKSVLEGAASKGMTTEEVFISDLDIAPCRGCATCKDTSEKCVIEDDFHGVVDKIRDADLVVIGSPVYMGQVTGQSKTFLDRLYSLRRRDRTIRLDGTRKKGVLVVVCGSTDPEHPNPAKRTLGVLFRYLNTPDVKEIVEQGTGPVGDLLKRPDALNRAKDVGATLAAGLAVEADGR